MDTTTAHYKVSNRGRQVWIFYLLVFDRIHGAMYLNKMCRTSGRKTGPQHYRSSSIFNRGHGVLFLPLFVLNSSGGFAAKNLFFSFMCPYKPVLFDVPVLSDN